MPIFLIRLARRLRRGQIAALLALAVVAVVAGAVLFSATQHVSVGTGLYWAITTATTVGYGDVTPHNALGRVVAVGEMLTAIPLFAGVFAAITAAAASTRIRRMLGMDHALPKEPYTLVFGSQSLVPLVLRDLSRRQIPLVLVADTSTSQVSLPDGVHLISGDPAAEEVIGRARPQDAREALIATPEDGDALIIAVILRKLAPSLPVVAVVASADVAAAMRDLGVTRTLSANELVGHAVAKSLETPHASDLLLSMLATDRYRLEELPVEPPWYGLTLTEVRGQAQGLVLGAVVSGSVVLGVAENPLLQHGDSLLLLHT